MSISSPLLPSAGVTTSLGCSLLVSPPSCAFDGGNAAQLMVVAANATVSAVGLSFQARPLASTLCAGFGTRPLSVARLAALCGVTHARFVEQNGRSGGAGGAVTIFGSFTARACAFDGDAAPVGGAVLVQRAASSETAVATLVSDVFSSDVADGGSGSGGAVDAEVGSLLTVVNSTFRNDLGVSGGAYEEAGDPTCPAATSAHLRHPRARVVIPPGAVYEYNGAAYFEGDTFSDNAAVVGGAIGAVKCAQISAPPLFCLLIRPSQLRRGRGYRPEQHLFQQFCAAGASHLAFNRRCLGPRCTRFGGLSSLISAPVFCALTPPPPFFSPVWGRNLKFPRGDVRREPHRGGTEPYRRFIRPKFGGVARRSRL